MSQPTLDEECLPSTWAILVAEISRAGDGGDLVRRALLALHEILPDSRSTLVWATDDMSDDPSVMDRLRTGTLIMGSTDHPGYVPVCYGGRLEGWVQVLPGYWSSRQEQAITLLAAVLGMARRALQPAPNDAGTRHQQLRAAISQVRDTLSLDALLEQLNRIAQQNIGCVCFLVVLRYQQSDWINLSYLSYDGERVTHRGFWGQRAGLTGTILQTGTTIFTDDYTETCIHHGVPPLYMFPGPTTCAWLGTPLRDSERIHGVISCFSTNPDVRFSPLQRELFLILAEETARPIRNAQMLLLAEQQARHMQSLNRITRTITSTLDPKRVPSLIIEQAQELFNAEEGSLLILDTQTGELVFSYAEGLAGHQLIGQRLPSGVGMASYVASSGQPAVVNNVGGDGRFYDTTDADTGILIRSLMAVPLRGIDGIRGVIEILNRRDDAPFTEEDRALLEVIADHAVIALENANHFAQIDQTLTRRLQELDRSNDRLHRILLASNTLRVERNREDLLHAIIQSVSESAGFRSCMIALVQHGNSSEPYLQYVLAAGPVAKMFKLIRATHTPLDQLHTLLRPEFRRSPLTYLIDRRCDEHMQPLGVRDHVYAPNTMPVPSGSWHSYNAMLSLLRNSRGDMLGLISVSDPEDGMQPGPEHVQILDILANQAAVALENAQLYSDLQHSLSSLTALNGLGMALNTTLRSPQEIYEMTLGGMMAQSEGRWGIVLLWHPQGTPGTLILGVQIDAAPVSLITIEQLAREAILLRRPQTMRPGEADSDAVVAIPLRATRGILGAICIGYADNVPHPSQIESLSLFAGQAAVAVESLQLFGAVRRGLDQLASIMASTREGMLLVDEASTIAVVNDAFRDLVNLASWPMTLEGMSISELLSRWQAIASYGQSDFEQFSIGLASVADGRERFVCGQLTSAISLARALEWSVLRAVPEGENNHEHEHKRPAHHWPILLTVRDITAAKDAERMRQDLTNMIVHDLRSPLTSVITSIDMIFRGTGGQISQLQRDILNIAYASTQHLLDMINLLLDISRLEVGQMPLDCAPIELPPLAERAISRMAMIAYKQNVTISLEPCAEDLRVMADHDLILRVLQNLLDNALKFSAKDSHIQVRTAHAERAGFVHVEVHDFGMGIKPLDLDKIFTKFGQADNRRGNGSGLGLTFCKLVVEAHGGTVGVKSIPGEGSTFFFTLPIAPRS